VEGVVQQIEYKQVKGSINPKIKNYLGCLTSDLASSGKGAMNLSCTNICRVCLIKIRETSTTSTSQDPDSQANSA